jgi:hypothetical protein
MRSLMICTAHQILFRWYNREWDGRGMWRVRWKDGVYTGFWLGNLMERLLGRPTRRWEDNIKMDLQEVGWGGVGWIDLAQDRDRWRIR